jgi:hypothetical protein
MSETKIDPENPKAPPSPTHTSTRRPIRREAEESESQAPDVSGDRITQLEAQLAEMSSALRDIVANPVVRDAIAAEQERKRVLAGPPAPPPDENGDVEVKVTHGTLLVKCKAGTGGKNADLREDEEYIAKGQTARVKLALAKTLVRKQMAKYTQEVEA